MNHLFSQWIGRCVAVGVLLAGIGLSTSAQAGMPQVASNEITNVAYAEKYSRSVKFQHLGPILGHHYDFKDKGSFVLQFTVSLEGVDTTRIVPGSLFDIIVRVTEGEGLEIEGIMSNDPKFQTGSTKAKFTYTEDVDGKVVKWGSVKFAINPVLGLLTVTIKAKSTASYRDGITLGDVGHRLLAGNYLTSASAVILDSAELQFAISDGSGSSLLLATGTMAYGGEVQASPQTDPEMGTFNAYKIGLAGTLAPH